MDRSDAPVPGPPLNETIRLACLVLSANAARRATLADALGDDARVALIDEASDSAELPGRLRLHAYDLVVVAPNPEDDALPQPLGTPIDDAPVVLVVPPLGHDAQRWLARGADDVVGLGHPETVRHAIRRVLEERAGHARVRETLRRLGDERALSDALFETHPHALALLRDDEPLRGNRRFDALVGADGERGRGVRWRDWLDAHSSRALAALGRGQRATLVLGTRRGTRHRALIEPLGTAAEAVRLLAIEPDPLAPRVAASAQTDPASGLLVREALVNRFDEMLASSRASRRYTAMRVQLPSGHPDTLPDGVGRAFEDLLVLRAAEALRGRFRGNTLLGRGDRSTLFVVRPGQRSEASRDLAARVRETLGSLGGFIEEPSAVRIDTLTLQARGLSARAVVERLERRRGASR